MSASRGRMITLHLQHGVRTEMHWSREKTAALVSVWRETNVQKQIENELKQMTCISAFSMSRLSYLGKAH